MGDRLNLPVAISGRGADRTGAGIDLSSWFWRRTHSRVIGGEWTVLAEPQAQEKMISKASSLFMQGLRASNYGVVLRLAL